MSVAQERLGKGVVSLGVIPSWPGSQGAGALLRFTGAGSNRQFLLLGDNNGLGAPIGRAAIGFPSPILATCISKTGAIVNHSASARHTGGAWCTIAMMIVITATVIKKHS